MKIALQYVSDNTGKKKSVQIPFTAWKKLIGKLKQYEQALQIKSDIKEAFDEVSELKKSTGKKQKFADFLHKL